MKQKLLTLLTLLVLCVTGVWGADFVEDYGSKILTYKDAFVFSQIELGSAEPNSNRIKVAQDASGTFTVSTKVSGIYISSIVFHEYSTDKIGLTVPNETGNVEKTDATNRKWTFTPASSTCTTATFTLSATGGQGQIDGVVVYLNDAGADLGESIWPTAVGSGTPKTVTISTNATTSYVSSVTTSGSYGTSDGINNVNFSNNGTVSISTTNPIKTIYFVWIANAPSADNKWTGSDGTYSKNTSKWTASSDNIKSVTFTKSESNTTRLAYMHITYYQSLTDVAAPTSLTCSEQTSTSLTYAWTAAEHATTYTATLYSDAGCTSQITQTTGITGTTVTFNTLSASSTYYCKVQSVGDGETYKTNGGTTDAVSGTTSAKAYSVSATSNNNEWGTAAAGAGSLDATETTEVTATANEGYKFVNWAVEGSGATLSSTTTNPTTLTIGTANATVTATFRALYTYAITYNAGANGTGTIDAGEKTEDAAFTLSSSTFTRDGYLQTGWSLTDGGEKAYELGGSYTDNATLTLYPFWTAAYKLTYDPNGGAGTMENTLNVGEIKLTPNAFSKEGYTFIGWATSQANADAGTVAYADKGSYTLSEDATIYAVWGENYYEFKPKTVTESIGIPKNSIVETSTNGSMTVVGLKTNTSGSESIKYTTAGLQLSGGSADSVRVVVNGYLQEGSVISVRLQPGGDNGNERGLKLYKLSSPTSNAATSFSFAKGGAWISSDIQYFSYTVTASDGLAGTNGFILQRNNSVYLSSLTITNCKPGAKITASGWNTFSCNKALDLSTIENGTAYVATAAEGSSVTLTPVEDKIVAAGTGLMIKGTAGATFTINTTTADATFSGTNLLKGLPDGGEVAKANNTDTWNYVFGWTDDVNNPGFYLVNTTLPTLDAGKAYLQTTAALSEPAAHLNIIFDGETTGINAIENSELRNENSDAPMYNLAGQKVSNSYKGIVIQNGKKVVKK